MRDLVDEYEAQCLAIRESQIEEDWREQIAASQTGKDLQPGDRVTYEWDSLRGRQLGTVQYSRGQYVRVRWDGQIIDATEWIPNIMRVE